MDSSLPDDHRAVMQRRIGEKDIFDQFRRWVGIYQRAGGNDIPQTGAALNDDQRTDTLLGKHGAAVANGVDAAHHIA